MGTNYELPLGGGDAMVSDVTIPCKGGQHVDFEVAAGRPMTTFSHWFGEYHISGRDEMFAMHTDDATELTDPQSGITLNMYT